MRVFGLTVQEITAICTAFISIVALFVSIFSGISQRKHNKNSVRPISAIKAKDYEDYISVSIQNVGTGPLTIKRLWCKESGSNIEHSTLFEMMPAITPPWATYVECCDGWTIQVGTQLELIALRPQSDQDKYNVRKKLSTITVFLDYKDIYDQKFHDERKLDLFGRHYQEEKSMSTTTPISLKKKGRK